MAVVSDFVAQICHLRLERSGPGLEPMAVARMIVTGFVFGQSLADFPCQIQAGKSGIFLLQLLDDAQALAIVLKPAVVFHQFVQDHLALMAEG